MAPAAPTVIEIRRTPGNGPAVTALILGILSALPTLTIFLTPLAIPTAVPGVVFGIVGIVRSTRVGGRGRALALWGLCLSAAPLTLLVFLWVAGSVLR